MVDVRSLGIVACCLVVGVAVGGLAVSATASTTASASASPATPSTVDVDIDAAEPWEGDHTPTTVTDTGVSAAETNGVSAVLVLVAFGAVLVGLWRVRRR